MNAKFARITYEDLPKEDNFDKIDIKMKTIREVLKILRRQECCCFSCNDDDWSIEHIGKPIEIDAQMFEKELLEYADKLLGYAKKR